VRLIVTNIFSQTDFVSAIGETISMREKMKEEEGRQEDQEDIKRRWNNYVVSIL